jgi:hypothetical protein
VLQCHLFGGNAFEKSCLRHQISIGQRGTASRLTFTAETSSPSLKSIIKLEPQVVQKR